MSVLSAPGTRRPNKRRTQRPNRPAEHHAERAGEVRGVGRHAVARALEDEDGADVVHLRYAINFIPQRFVRSS